MAVVLFLIGGTLGAAFLHPGKVPWGIPHSAAFSTALVLAALAWGVLSCAPAKWVTVVSAGMVAEFLLMFWSHRWLLNHNPGVLEPDRTRAEFREADVMMLNEHLGDAEGIFLAGAVIIQVVLIVLLLRTGRNRPVTAAGEERTYNTAGPDKAIGRH